MVFLEYINFEHNTVAAELVRQTYDTPPLAFVHSYGCQQNVNDGERIKGVLVDIGYGLCDKPEDADLILFNTCAVREHAEQRVFGNVAIPMSIWSLAWMASIRCPSSLLRSCRSISAC